MNALLQMKSGCKWNQGANEIRVQMNALLQMKSGCKWNQGANEIRVQMKSGCKWTHCCKWNQGAGAEAAAARRLMTGSDNWVDPLAYRDALYEPDYDQVCVCVCVCEFLLLCVSHLNAVLCGFNVRNLLLRSWTTTNHVQVCMCVYHTCVCRLKCCYCFVLGFYVSNLLLWS